MAVKSINSGLSSYCSVVQFLKRYDARTVGDLVSDDGTRVTPSGLSSNAVLLALLQEASAKVEAAAVVGNRYSPADLAEFANPTTVGNTAMAGSNMSEFLAGIVAHLTMPLLYRRRPDATLPMMPQLEEAERLLNALADGVKIFGFQETMDAGIMDDEIETPTDVEARQLVTYTARRLFGTRNNRMWPQPTGGSTNGWW